MYGYQPLFQDRTEAGQRLAQLLIPYRDASPVVLALPRGGVPIGYEIALMLSAPLDLVLVRKIGAPINPEFGIGAVVDGQSPVTVIDEDLVRRVGISEAYIERTTQAELEEIERRRALYLKGRPPVDIKGRTAIVVDDGIATGSTMRVALRALRAAQPARLVMAVPVAPPDTLEEMRSDCDEAVCLATPEDFRAVGAFYRDFQQVGDAEVIDLLDRAASPGTASA
ncbi:MAG TPA: phosphoribosyltransferase [Azospirillum sp.]|nr:phosphoribosyltransferase [Azospirillum sp.]